MISTRKKKCASIQQNLFQVFPSILPMLSFYTSYSIFSPFFHFTENKHLGLLRCCSVGLCGHFYLALNKFIFIGAVCSLTWSAPPRYVNYSKWIHKCKWITYLDECGLQCPYITQTNFSSFQTIKGFLIYNFHVQGDTSTFAWITWNINHCVTVKKSDESMECRTVTRKLTTAIIVIHKSKWNGEMSICFVSTMSSCCIIWYYGSPHVFVGLIFSLTLKHALQSEICSSAFITEWEPVGGIFLCKVSLLLSCANGNIILSGFVSWKVCDTRCHRRVF